MNASERYGSDRPIKVDILFAEDRCMHRKSVFARCDSCVSACPSHAIHREGEAAVPRFDAALCLHCGTCLSACPFEAFRATNFSERRALKRMGGQGPVRVRCWLPHGELSALASPTDTYQMAVCLAALTPAALFSMACERQCTLVTDRCEACALYRTVGSVLRGNMERARALLGDWYRAENLIDSGGIAFSGGEAAAQPPASAEVAAAEPPAPAEPPAAGVAAATTAGASAPASAGPAPRFAVPATGAERDAGAEAGVSRDGERGTSGFRSSARALFRRVMAAKDETVDGSEGVGSPSRSVKRHAIGWRLHLERYWRDEAARTDGGTYQWPVQQVDDRRCAGCGTCAQMCPTGAIQLTAEDGALVYRFNAGLCSECELCLRSCAQRAIRRGARAAADPFEAREAYRQPIAPCRRCGDLAPARSQVDGLCRPCALETGAASWAPAGEPPSSSDEGTACP